MGPRDRRVAGVLTMDETEKNLQHTAAMKALKAERAEMMRTKTEKRGLLIVHTGDGKGKSTAAFGMVARALGWGLQVGIVQFIKGKWKTGERQFFAKFPEQVRYEVMGEGFTWETQDRARDIAAATAAWNTAKQMIADPDLDFVLLDELNIALRYEYLDIGDVIATLSAHPADKHVCITGRDAPVSLIEIADLVTEMRAVKHPFAKGMKVQKGVDF
jgi:cob(I)alamin adenosyltransferase